MVTIESVLSEDNVKRALDHLLVKKDSICSDGMRIADLPEYWSMNGERIREMILRCEYKPDIIKNYEITNAHGKRRTVSSLAGPDRLICRMLSQQMNRELDGLFSENSFAYREGRGIQAAVERVREYARQGKTVVVAIDIRNFFDIISHEELMKKTGRIVEDTAVLFLIERYLQCLIQNDDDITEKIRGIVQGNPISPILSNIYMMDMDAFMDKGGYSWIRFADNIFAFFEDEDTAREVFTLICNKLREPQWDLTVNQEKSGVYRDITSVRILGYDFKKRGEDIDVRKAVYEKKKFYSSWHPCIVSKVNREYHIVQNGILNKKDYALLFENDDNKHHIPVEVTDQLNIYGSINIASGVIKTLSDNRIRLCLTDKYGNLMAHIVPSEYSQSGAVTIKQCELYLDDKRRFDTARAFEIAGIHNMRANLRYYKKKNKELSLVVDGLTECIRQVNESATIGDMMLIEARAKQKYYRAFNDIIKEKEFEFTQRTKRPPRDELNAMISFGNVVLYNMFLQYIWRYSLDPRIGVVHSTTRRNASLNLDFADVFKPVITDRIIFSLVNCHRISIRKDFVKRSDGVYMSESGKRIYLEALEEKLGQQIVMGDRSISYRRLIEGEVLKFQKFIISGGKFKPYKYY